MTASAITGTNVKHVRLLSAKDVDIRTTDASRGGGDGFIPERILQRVKVNQLYNFVKRSHHPSPTTTPKTNDDSLV